MKTTLDRNNEVLRMDFGGTDFALVAEVIVNPEALAREKREAEDRHAGQLEMFGGEVSP
jgi:hypothetical protein